MRKITVDGREYQELTRMERNQVYREVFRTFENCFAGPFLCNVCSIVLRRRHNITYQISSKEWSANRIVAEFLPELAPHLPKNPGGWPANKEWNEHRADLLAQCIEDTNAM